MTHVRSRKFCCCLPVRFGIICESLLGLGLGGFIAIGGWIQVNALREWSVSYDLFHAAGRALQVARQAAWT